jgi:type I restriction enzyme S subunit
MEVNKETLPKGWMIAKFEDLLDYIQPTNYIVKSTDYKDTYPTPVLTAGKSFIKGYTNETDGIFTKLPTIIFDDFTTATQFVNFPFKVKSSAMKILQPTCDLVNIKLAYYFMQTVHLKGETHKRFWISEYSQLPVPLAPLNEQKRILAKLEQLLTDLDKGIEYLDTTKQQLKVYRQAVLKWAFEGKLTNKNVKDGELPKGWKWEKINELLIHPKKGMTTGPFGTSLKKHEHTNSGVPVLGIENIGEGKFVMPNKIFVTPKKAEALNSFRVIENDIIISRSGTVGEICVVPKQMQGSVISTNIIRVRLNQEIISPKLFVYMFQGGTVKEKVKELCKGSTRAFLNQTILNQLDFPYCSTFEQNKILQEIESRLSVCDKIEETIESSLQQAEALRLSIIKKAFEGKLVSQNPSDEHAEKLLERIRAAKGNRKPEKKEQIEKKVKTQKVAV